METIIEIDVFGFDNAVISENEEYYFVDLRTGNGEGTYLKSDYTLEEAINDQINLQL